MTADIRVLRRGEIETLLDWAAAEGLDPGLHDAKAFAAADPHGFLGAFVGQQLVAGISVVAYDEHFGFLGLYICHPNHRGQGLGRLVWNAGMAYLGDRTIGLDGVPGQQANYRRMGFVARYETLRLGGVMERRAARSCSVAPLTEIAPVLALDRACFPAARPDFLAAWIAPPHRAHVAMRDGHVAGYMVVRPCRSHQKVGPLFADDLQAAIDPIGSVEGPLSIDIPAPQDGMIAYLTANGFRSDFRTARMYRGEAPQLDLERIFGVTTLELG